MSKRSLSLIIGLLGTAGCFVGLFGISLMGSLMADARTENITGPGADLFLRTPFPPPQSTVVLDVDARGGSRAGIRRVRVTHDGAELAAVKGAGATWGSTIRSGKSRGSDTVRVEFALPAAASAGTKFDLDVDVHYVVALSSGSTFDNKSFSDRVRLTVPVSSASAAFWSRAKILGRGLLLFTIWFALCFGFGRLLHHLEDDGEGDGEMLGVALIAAAAGGGLLGHWLFARPVVAAFGASGNLGAGLLTVVWLVGPAAFTIWWIRRQPKLVGFSVSVPRSVNLMKTLIGPLGYEVKARGSAFVARRGKDRMELRRENGDQVTIRATSFTLPLALLHQLVRRTGPLTLHADTGISFDVTDDKSLQQLELDYGERLMDHAQQTLAEMFAMHQALLGDAASVTRKQDKSGVSDRDFSRGLCEEPSPPPPPRQEERSRPR